ncbi:MAG: ATP-binding protein [Acidimicrobiales bacterium]
MTFFLLVALAVATSVLLVSLHASDRRRRELDRSLADLKAAQAQLLHIQKLESIGQLANGIAHEINTPIQYIGDNLRFLEQSFTDLLAMVGRATVGDDDEGELRYLLAEVPDALSQTMVGIDRVADIVRAMKGVAHPNSDRAAGVELNRLIDDTLTVTRNAWKSVATIDLQLDPSLPPIHAAPGPVGQVILSTIMNAVDAIVDRHGATAAEEGLISIVTRGRGDCVELEVTDNGCGMSDAVMARAFDPFFTTKGVGRGTGQGLTVTHAVVVEQHGGSVTLDSTPGVGTTVRIELPVASAQVKAAYLANSQAVTSSGSPAALAS